MEIENYKKPYSKPPKSIEGQIAILQSRGLIVPDKDRLSGYLENISYYHLSAYFKAFQRTADVFNKNVTFDDVINVYEFDKKLRLLMLDVTERIEKSFKCRVVYNISLTTNDSHWHSKTSSYVNDESFNKYIKDLLEEAKSSKDIDLKNYYRKYSSPEYPPAWTFFESLSFGQLVSFYRNFNSSNKKVVARTFGISHKYITSWMYGLSVVRNISAHYARLWDRDLFATMMLDHGNYKDLFNRERPNCIYNYLVVAHIFMHKINPTSAWLVRLVGIINEHEIDVALMGFPDDWKNRFIRIETV